VDHGITPAYPAKELCQQTLWLSEFQIVHIKGTSWIRSDEKPIYFIWTVILVMFCLLHFYLFFSILFHFFHLQADLNPPPPPHPTPKGETKSLSWNNIQTTSSLLDLNFFSFFFFFFFSLRKQQYIFKSSCHRDKNSLRQKGLQCISSVTCTQNPVRASWCPLSQRPKIIRWRQGDVMEKSTQRDNELVKQVMVSKKVPYKTDIQSTTRSVSRFGLAVRR